MGVGIGLEVEVDESWQDGVWIWRSAFEHHCERETEVDSETVTDNTDNDCCQMNGIIFHFDIYCQTDSLHASQRQSQQTKVGVRCQIHNRGCL